jgi:hypothetical protein
MSFPLAVYLQKFPEVCREKFDRTYDFAALEKRFRTHAVGKQPLTPKDVDEIFDREKTPFKGYWLKPRTKDLEKALKPKPLILGPLEKVDIRNLITQLLNVCHSIGTVSLVLRFVHPEQFGVFSTPVIHLLLVSSPNTVDLYLAYCEELAKWKEHFHIHTVAQTEMALWTYTQISKGADAPAKSAIEDFEKDYWIQQRRVAQVLRPFLQRYGRLQLARILLEEDHILAGKIAAEEYERLLDVACWTLRGQPLPDKKGAAEVLIEELANESKIRLEDKAELKRIWETRNRAVHPRRKRPEREEVDVMIDCIERVCQPWEKGAKGKRP